MIPTMLATTIGLVLGANAGAGPEQEARADDAASHVKLALKYESLGSNADRIKHLARAVLLDPSGTVARGLLGVVRYGGEWLSPDDVAGRLKSDPALAAARAEYDRRRDSLKETPEEHYRLGVWCEENKLDAEAKAHLSNAVRLNPSHEAAWRRLGYKKRDGVWSSDEKFSEQEREKKLQAQADREWRPRLQKYKGMLAGKNPAARDEAEAKLAEISDPRAVPSIWSVFAAGTPDSQEIAARALGPIEGGGASLALATLAVYGGSERVRAVAVDVLKRRDGREFAGFLISQIRKPVKYEIKPAAGPGSPGVLFVEGERFNIRRIYVPSTRTLSLIPPRLYSADVPLPTTAAYAAAPLFVGRPRETDAVTSARATAMNRDILVAALTERNARIVAMETAASRRNLDEDVARVETINATIKETTARVLYALREVSGEDHGEDVPAWRKWQGDQEGLVFLRGGGTELPKPTFETRVESVVDLPDPTVVYVFNQPQPPISHRSCFAAGTPVRTIDGFKSIELLKVGDQVLAQNPNTGGLSYRPVVTVYRNPPSATLRIDVGDKDVIVATGIHRFWRAGQGWVMARDLKKGDTLRVLGGTRKIVAITADEMVQPVFNLEVDGDHSFLVGRAGALVHDNSLVRPVSEPFDAPPPSVVAAKRP